MQRIRLHRDSHLLGKWLEVLRVLLDVVRPVVADRAQRLTGEAAADDCLVLVGMQQRVLVAAHTTGLRRRDEPRAQPDAVPAEDQCGREASAVEDPTGGNDGDALADGVDDLRDERHRRDRAGVSTRFRALGDDEIAAGFDRRDRVTHLPAHARDENVPVMEDLDDVARNAEAGDEERCAALHDALSVFEHPVRQRREEVDAERLRRQLSYRPHLRIELLGRHRRRTQRAEPARVRDRGDQAVVRDAAHAGQHHGVFDAEHLGESCMHGGKCYLSDDRRSISVGA